MADTPAVKVLSGPKILLMGPSGTGKTHILGSLVEWAAKNGQEVFVLFTEDGLETLLGYWKDETPAFPKGRPVPDNLHWQVLKTKPLGIKDLMTAADNVAKLSYEAITKMIDPNRSLNNAAYKILAACSNFKDDRTGKEYGPVDAFKTDKIFVNDSLSETANAFMKMVIGSKPTASQPDYGVAQNNLMNFLRLLTQALECTFVMTAHVDRQNDYVSGSSKIVVKAIGQAMSPDIPPLFSDVILTVREADKFYWDTAAFGADTKTRSLGYRSKITPDFAAIMDVWKTRSAV